MRLEGGVHLNTPLNTPNGTTFNCIIFFVLTNAYGHPVREVVNRAKKFPKKLYRTDKKGAIVFKTDGKKLSTSFIKVVHSSAGSYSRPRSPYGNVET